MRESTYTEICRVGPHNPLRHAKPGTEDPRVRPHRAINAVERGIGRSERELREIGLDW
jgi:hypothetical protein